MKTRWAIAACVAMFACVCAIQEPMFSRDRTLAEEPGSRSSSASQSRPEWRDHFDINKADLLPTGTNAYIPMQPGRVLKLKHGNDTLTVTVLSETQAIDGLVAGVLEERETKNGTLVEVSRNFMATHKDTGDVYYFGEDVDNYKGGKVVNHESSTLR